MNWHGFKSAAPLIGELAQRAFADQHLAILGTLRRDGWPRISPCEVYFVGDEMLLGMMPRSAKVLDLWRDARITVVNGQEKREPKLGDVKLYGTAIEITDNDQRERFADAQEAVIDWRPPADIPIFAVDIEHASYISFGKEHRLLIWTPGSGEVAQRHPDDGAEA